MAKYDAGLRKLNERFKKLPGIARERLMAATKEAADEMANEMRRIAPEDTGKLKESIAVTGPGETTPAHSQPGGSTTVPDGMYYITAGNNGVRYAHLVEWGTEKTEAQPFFFPVIRSMRKKVKSKLRREARKAVKESLQ